VQDLTDRQPVTDHRQHGLIPSLGDAPDKVVASGNITLADYAKAWIRERNVKPRTRIGYEVLASAGTSTPPWRARDQLPFWSGQYTVMASLMNCAACALVIPCDSSSV
jgi:hypothetical protein